MFIHILTNTGVRIETNLQADRQKTDD